MVTIDSGLVLWLLGACMSAQVIVKCTYNANQIYVIALAQQLVTLSQMAE